ncbi:hypothetical protein HDU97_000323 [Phlyctochytrium planicorne]|nr:hypothetical protein HDU97_000323 [Phlyctochytrium planicorne]
MRKRGKFDYILLETTGMADPGPIASMFWLDEGVKSDVCLDGIVTVVDSVYVQKGFEKQLEESNKDDGSINECERQIALADRILINKSDLVTDATARQSVEASIRAINPVAPFLWTSRSQIPIDFILNLNAFTSTQTPSIDPTLLTCTSSTCISTTQNHHHTHPSPSPHINRANGITTTLIPIPPATLIPLKNLDLWLRSLLWENKLPNTTSYNPDPEVLRLKALVDVRNEDGKDVTVVVQAVRELYEWREVEVGKELKEGYQKVVVIGRNLDEELIIESFNASCPPIVSP